MALNTNIALGVQPIQQQPNMLAQYAQIMGIKAAQQEMEGNDAVRAAYAQGGDLSNPEFRRKIMAANPQLGSKLVNQFSEMSARDVKTQADSLKIIKDNAGMARSPAEMAEYLKGAYSTPGGALLSKLVPYDKAVASIPTDQKAFADYQRNFSLTADKLFTSASDELRAKVDREGHGVQMRGQNLISQTAANRLDFDRKKRSVIAGDNQYYTTGAFGDIQPVTGYGVVSPSTMPSAPAMLPAAANAFVTRPSVNSLLNQTGQTSAPTAPPQVVPGSPTVANAAAVAAQDNVPRPKKTSENLTEAQGKATGFAARARQASDILDMVGQDGKVQPGLIKRIAEATPLVGEGLGTIANVTQSSAQQQVEQAQRNFVNAVLRQESGAAVNKDEFDNAKKQYFPQPGDSAEVIEQKRLNRKTAIESFEIAAGPGMKKVSNPIKVGTVEEGYRYKGGDPANKNNWEKQ